MKGAVEKYLRSIVVFIALSFAFVLAANAQGILSYGPKEPTAFVHYNKMLYGIYKNSYKQSSNYPIKGAYSPTHYAITSSFMGVGNCNYICIPTKNALLPGRQYRINLTVKVGKAYEQMPYFQSYFGIALASDLNENHFGLWSKHFIPLGIETTEKMVSVDIVFRPLCTSKYLVLGVFQGPTMDKQNCFACQYGFELYNLMVDQYDETNADFVYICDAFEEERLTRTFSTGYDTDTVYFDSGSSEVQGKYLSVLDSIPSKLRTKQDLVTLYAYTDRNGSDNEALGATRNTAVRDALVLRGIDTTRILMVNYGEARASNVVSQKDRRVEIDINRGKLYQKYYTEALQAAEQGDFRIAQARIGQWLKMVPPDFAIYALFDCWGRDEKVDLFKRTLIQNIRSKYYRGKDLKFTLDSLYCEDQRRRTLSMSLGMNRLPDCKITCDDNLHSLQNVDYNNIVDIIYSQHGFPTIEEVGERGNKVLPYLILHSEDTSFQKLYLPRIQKACEEELVSWEYYAMLYDKICIRSNGYQRYGTQWIIDKNGVLSGLVPLEDEDRVAEFRKQVGLVPLSDF